MGGVSKEWREGTGGEEEQERRGQRSRRTGVKRSDTWVEVMGGGSGWEGKKTARQVNEERATRAGVAQMTMRCELWRRNL